MRFLAETPGDPPVLDVNRIGTDVSSSDCTNIGFSMIEDVGAKILGVVLQLCEL